jgi:hypothetical protein
MVPRDRRQERHFHDLFHDAGTGAPRANATEPRAFRVFIRNQLERRDWLAGAPGIEPGNGGIKNSLPPSPPCFIATQKIS